MPTHFTSSRCAQLTNSPRVARMADQLASFALLACIAGALAILPGCLPSRVTLDLAPTDGALETSTVLTDEGANRFSPAVALIRLDGLISHAPPTGLVRTTENPVDRFVARLNAAEHDDRVKAVILRLNSPGGTVSASETIANELDGFRARSGKPVIASMSGIATSGAYYAALSTDHIMAQQSSITGSIGVLMQTVNVSRGLGMIGIEGRAVTSAPNKDLANPLEPIEEDHYVILQEIVDEFYLAFRGRVLDRRGSISDVQTATDGRVYTGERALELGMVDAIGDVRDAFATAKDRAGLDRARLIAYHRAGRALTTPYALDAAGGPPALHTSSALDRAARALESLATPASSGAGLDGAGFYYLWVPPTPQ